MLVAPAHRWQVVALTMRGSVAFVAPASSRLIDGSWNRRGIRVSFSARAAVSRLEAGATEEALPRTACEFHLGILLAGIRLWGIYQTMRAIRAALQPPQRL